MNEYGNFIRRADLIKNLIEREKLAEETAKPNKALIDANKQRWIKYQELLRHRITAEVAAANSVGGLVEPSFLFANAEKGVWFDVSDMSTLFVDPAGTIPVTASGATVGKILDKSGNGFHATQSIAANRPTYLIDPYGYPYLSFDGTNDFMVTAPINFTDTAQMHAAIGLLVDPTKVTAGVPLELSVGVESNAGSFAISAPSSTADHAFSLRGSSASAVVARVANIVSGDDVLTGLFDISQATKELEITPRLAGQIQTNVTWSGATSAGTGNFGNYSLYIGARGGSSVFFKGHIYQIIVRGYASNNSYVEHVEGWINSKLD